MWKYKIPRLITVVALFMATVILSVAPTGSKATEINDFINGRNCDQVLDKGYYKICYDYNAKGAKYVAYELSANTVNAVNIKKRPRFYPDRAIPRQYRTYPDNYTHNEFHADRGHLAPDAAFDYSQQSLHSAYSMANIIPQYRWTNRKTWSKAERYSRLMAARLGRVTVINGVVYDRNPPHLRISGIAYPRAYWKMIYDNHGFKRCLLYSNSSRVNIKEDRLKDHEVPCENLVKMMLD